MVNEVLGMVGMIVPVVVAEDELYAERFARWKIDDFKKAKLEVWEIVLEAGEQILSVENTGV